MTADQPKAKTNANRCGHRGQLGHGGPSPAEGCGIGRHRDPHAPSLHLARPVDPVVRVRILMSCGRHRGPGGASVAGALFPRRWFSFRRAPRRGADFGGVLRALARLGRPWSLSKAWRGLEWPHAEGREGSVGGWVGGGSVFPPIVGRIKSAAARTKLISEGEFSYFSTLFLALSVCCYCL